MALTFANPRILGPTPQPSDAVSLDAVARNIKRQLGGEISTLPDETLLGEEPGLQYLRDNNEKDTKDAKYFSYTASRRIQTNVLNEFRGIPLMMNFGVEISRMTRHRTGGADIEMVAWDNTALGGLGTGTTWYNWAEESRSARYKAHQDVINELLADDRFAKAAIDLCLEMLTRTAMFTMMQNFCRAFTSRPYKDDMKNMAKKRSHGHFVIQDVYHRFEEYMLAGIRTPREAYMLLRRAMKTARPGVIMDCLVPAQGDEHRMLAQSALHKDFTTQIHDIDGFVTNVAGKTMDTAITIPVVADIGGVDGETKILPCPTLVQRESDSEVYGEQALSRAVTSGIEYIFPTHARAISGLEELSPNHTAMAILDVRGKQGNHKVMLLHDAIRQTFCGGIFSNRDTTELSQWAATHLAALQAKSAKWRGEAFDNLTDMRDMNTPTYRMTAALRDGNPVRDIAGWRNVPFWVTFDEDHGIVQAKTIGQMLECMLNTATLIEFNEVMLRGLGDGAGDAARALIGRILGRRVADLAAVPDAALSDAQLLNALVAGAAPAPALRGPATAAPTHATLRSDAVQHLLGEVPNAGLAALRPLLPALDGLVAAGHQHAKAVVQQMQRRLATFKTDVGKRNLWMTKLLKDTVSLTDGLRATPPTVDEGTVKSVEIYFIQPGEGDGASHIPATPEALAAAYSDASAWKTALAARPAATLGVPLWEQLPGRAAGQNDDVVFAAGISPSRVPEIIHYLRGSNRTAAEVTLLVAILKTPLTVDALYRLHSVGYSIIGGSILRPSLRLRLHSVMVARSGKDTVVSHFTPMISEYSIVGSQGRSYVDASFMQGVHFTDSRGVMELPGFWPNALEGGFRATLQEDAKEVRRMFTTADPWLDAAQRATMRDCVFAPMPYTETEHDFDLGQCWLSEPVLPVSRPGGDGVSVMRLVSSTHTHMQALIGGPAAVSRIQKEYIGRYQAGPHLMTRVSPMYHLGHRYRYSEVSKKFDVPLLGTGPLGASELNDPATIGRILNGDMVAPPENVTIREAQV